ncbi:hypothetical protein [Actinomadura xylanilytica]|uniref:hypothetical protein n=1 Tax=Actinomadura xylanilytica TaxID=887459 RepID=UPI00255A8341|nr:hypothetical protein [Actinomadura xylanilytica]MDL4772245.1 hypothetical protein [Actinomadura xylanilytica]
MSMTKSPRRLKQQVQDTVGEQVRDLPLHAVRLAMFGVGRALLLSDRVTKDYREITEGGGVRPVLDRLRTDVQSTAEKVVGQVVERVKGGEDEPEPAPRPRPRPRPRATERPARPKSNSEIAVGKPAAPEPAAKAEPEDRPDPAGKPAFEPKPEVKPAAQAEVEHLTADLPVPNYDEATLPQLRARLRGLSTDQVKLLREYERKHAARPDVIKMYENRIAKLNGNG